MSIVSSARRRTRPLLLAAVWAVGTGCPSGPTEVPDAGDAHPETTITGGTEGTTSEPSATFTFTCDDTGCTFECALDSAAFEPCESPVSYSQLDQGVHTFRVRASTTNGGTDPTPATRTWTYDAPPPETLLDSGPEGTTHLVSATFTFRSTATGVTLECALDGAAFEACTSPLTYDDLPDGEHTFQARAVGGEKVDPTPAARTWTIDTRRQPRKWLDRAGNLFIADTANCVIRKVTARDGTIATIAGAPGDCTSTGDGGPATAATLADPLAIALGPAGDLFIVENGNRIRRIDPATGTITTVVGGGTGELAEGAAPTSGALQGSYTLFVNAAGDLFFGEGTRLRVLRAATGVVTTLAGGAAECAPPATGANALAVCFPEPLYAIAEGPSGAIFIASAPQVFRLDPGTGTLTHVAGHGQWDDSGDNGPAVAAGLRAPTGLATDADGNLYIADSASHAVRRVTAATGTISTVAGTLGTSGNTGDGTAATAALLNGPGDLAFDPAGDLSIADTYNNVIRRVDRASGTISLVAGDYTQGFGGDGGAATAAKLSRPGGFWWWWD